MKKLLHFVFVLTVALCLAAPADIALANFGGPDSAGYGWIDSKTPTPSVPYNWIDISTTGTNTGIHCDDCYSGAIPIGFTFSYYGNNYSYLYITSNGIVSFSGGTSQYSNYSIADGSTPSNAFYPFWDDLYSTSPGNIYYQTLGEAPNRMFVIQYSNLQFYSDRGGRLNYEAILYEGTNTITFQYKSMTGGWWNGSSATVGIKGPSGSGLQYSYNSGAISNGLAITFSRSLEVASKYPASGAQGVLTNANVRVGFNQPLDPASVSASAITATGSQSGAISGTVSYLTALSSIQFDPSANFRPGETVTVTLNPGFRSQTGSGIASPVTWQFTAGADADTDPPPQVTGVTAADVPNDAGSKIQLSWSAVSASDLVLYRIYRSTSPITSVLGLTPVGTSVMTSYVDSTTNGTVYYYAVTAFDACGNESAPGLAPGPVYSVNDPPRPVTGLNGGVSSGGINLYWNANTDSDFAGYKIYYGTSSGNYGTPLDIGNRTSYELTGLQNCTTYYITITAYDPAGNESLRSSEVVIGNGSPGAPSAPTGLTASAINGSVNLRWNQNPECDVTGYYVYRSTSSGSGYQYLTSLSGASTTTYQDPAIANGTTYYYRIAAYDSFSLVSPNSAEVSAIAIDTIPPNQPSSLSPSSNVSGIYLSWYGNNYSARDLAGYKIYDGTASGNYSSTIVVPTTYGEWNSYVLSSLSNCTDYYIAVSSYDLSGNESPRSAEVVFNSGQAGSPSSPSGLYVTSEESKITVEWNPNRECDIQDYYVYRSTANNSSYQYVTTVSEARYLDFRTAHGTTYFYKIIARDRAGSASPYSAEVSAVAINTTSPQAPSLNVGASQGSTYLYLWWNSNPEPDISSYKIYYGTSSGNYSQTVATGSTSYNLYGLQACALNYLTLTAIDLSGNESARSAEKSAMVSGTSSLQPPSGLSASSAESAINLSWNANPECDINYYKVYRSSTTGSGYQEIATVNPGTSYQDKKLANGTTYYYRVKAYNYTGIESPYSAEVSAIATDSTPPQAPPWVSLTSGDGYLDVSWGNSPSVDLNQYRVYYDTQHGVYGAPLTATSQSLRINSLNPCSTYYVTVRAVDFSNLESAAAQEASGRVNVAGVPSVPTGLSGEGGNNSASLNWTPNAECDVKEYQIFRSSSSGGAFQQVGTSSGTTFTDRNLQSETTYYYVIKAVDYSGLVSNTSAQVQAITRDTIPPVPPVLDSALTMVTNATTYAIRGIKEVNSSIIINGTVVIPVNGSTTWETTVNLFPIHNNFAITSKDSSGNECAPVNIDVVRDTQPPQLSTSNPANGFLTNQPVTSVTLTLSDPLSGVSLAQSLTGATARDQQQTVVPGQWSAQGTDRLVFAASAPMQEGVYTVSAAPADNVGNVGSISVTFTVDQTPPPPPTITTYAALSNAASQNISGAKNSDAAAIVVTLNDNQVPPNKITYPSATSWQASVSGFSEGINNITAYAKDAAGNQSAGITVSLLYDTTPPAVPAVNSYTPLTKETTQTITGTKDANSYLYVNNVKTSAPFADSTWSYTVNLNEGANSFSLFSKDEAGNSGQSTTVSVTKDTTPPRILSSTPTVSAYTNQAGTVEITLTDNGSTPDLAASLTGAVVKNTAGTVVNGTWNTSEALLIFTPMIQLSDGVYSVTIYPVDNLGNKGSATFSFTLDRAPPTVQGLALNPVSPVKAGTVTFTLAFSESMTTSIQPTVTFSRGFFSTTYTLTGSWHDSKTWRGSYPFTADNGDGSYSIKVSGAMDVAGNTMTDQEAGTFILDTTPPAAPTVATVTTPTRTASQTLTGAKPADTALVINGAVRVPLNNANTWSYSYPLAEGTNTLTIIARDAAGNNSPAITPPPAIVLDTTPPFFSVDTYQHPSTTATQTISGRKEPGCIVKLNGATIFDAADQNATWSYLLILTEGITNHLVFAAADSLGNTTTKTIDILYDLAPPAALGAGMLVANGSGKGTEVALSWPSYVESADLAYYRVYYAPADFTAISALTPVGTVNKGTRSFKVSGLTQGTTYFFAVVPVDASGNLDPAVHTASAIPADAVAPEEVTGLAAWAGYSIADGNYITLSWTASANTTGDLAEQILYMDGGQGYDSGVPIGKTATTFTKKGLADATSYKFKLTTKDTLGHESAGAVVTAVTRLANPAGLTATPSNQKVTLSWSGVSSPYVKLYNVYRLQSAAPQTDALAMILVKSQTGLSFTDTGLVNGTTYQYAVTTLSSSGAERTDVQSIAAAPRGDTTGPVIGGVNLTANQVITAPVTITASATDAESAVANIELFIDGLLVKSQTGSSISHAWHVVQAVDGNHTVRIAAYDAPGNLTEQIIPVVVSLAPPAAPVITTTFGGPINVNTATISGTAQAGSTVTLRVNGVVVSSVSAATSNFSFPAVPLAEGINSVAAKAGNRGGDSPFSADTKITVVTTAPEAPVNLVAKPLAGGSIQFSWQAGGSGAVGYNLYEGMTSLGGVNESGVHKVNSTPIPYLLKEYIPADDTPRFYTVTAIDGAGNESPISNVVAIAADRAVPTVSVVQFLHNSEFIITNSATGPGTVQVAVTVSEALSETPFFSLEPQNASPVIVPLRKSDDTHYAGSITLDATSPHGPTTWKFSGKDLVGNRGNSQGAGLTIDVKGPQASITTPLTLLKTIAGPVSVALVFDEPSTTMPTLTLRASDGGTAQVAGMTSTDSGLNWSGTLDPAALAEGSAQFLLAGARDRFGNIGTTVKNGGSILLYKTNPPASAVPSGLAAKPGKGGAVALSWTKVADAQGYNVYRQGAGDSAPLLIDSISSGATVTFSDTPVVDGSYSYSVSSLGLLGVESAQSGQVSAVSDRTPSPVPTGLALTLSGNGVQASWDVVAAPAEIPASYRLFRSGSVITDVAGLAPLLTVKSTPATDSSPTKSLRFYAVTALDALGNESAPSPTQEITFPVAPVGNLTLTLVDDGKPALSWTSGEANLQGFYIYRNGSKINQAPTISTTYSDGYYSSGSVTYGVSAVDATGAESPVKEVTLPSLTIALKDGTVMHRGALETITLMASLPSPLGPTSGSQVVDGQGEGVVIDAVTVKIGTLPESTGIAPFTVIPGTPLEIKKVAATEANAPPQEAVVVTAVMHPAPGTTVKLTKSSLVSVLGSGTALEIFNEPLVRGTRASVRIKVNSLGSARSEFLTSENGGATSHVTVYLKDQDGNLLAQGNLSQRTGAVVNSGSYATARLEPGESFLSDPITFTVPATAPYKVSLEAVIDNNYFHYQQDDQVVAPGLKQSVETTIADVSYTAQATTDKSIYRQGENIVISGQTISTTSGQQMPLVPVKIGVSVKGFDRFFTVNTDQSGAFSYTFTPASNEAGKYSVWAMHPDLSGRSVQAQFNIIGLQVSPLLANLTTTRGRAVEVPVTLRNLADTALTGLTLTPSSSSGITATVVNGGSDRLAGGETRVVAFRLTSDASAPDTGFASLAIATAEGLAEKVDANVTLVSAIPVIKTSPSYIDTGIVRGNQKIATFSINNAGIETLRNARIEGPSLPWMSLTVDKSIGNIEVGSSREVGILLKPAETVPQGIFDDRVVIYSDNHIPYTYNIQVTVTSSAVGSVRFNVIDSLLKKVGGANITLQHQTVPDLYYSLATASDGTVAVTDIPEGRYTYNASAAGHKPFGGSFVITPGIWTNVPVALEVTLVQIEWSVTPVIIEDRYEITVKQTFETNVPTPVIVTEPPGMALSRLQPGQVFNGEFTVTNYGLVAADYKGVTFPASFADYDLEVLANVPSRLNAMQKITIPYRVTRRQQSTPLASGTSTAMADLYEEVKGYGGSSCSGAAIVSTGWGYTICPNTDSERSGSSSADHTITYDDCSSGGSSSAGGTPPPPPPPPSVYYGGGGASSQMDTGGGFAVLTPLPDSIVVCIIPIPCEGPECDDPGDGDDPAGPDDAGSPGDPTGPDGDPPASDPPGPPPTDPPGPEPPASPGPPGDPPPRPSPDPFPPGYGPRCEG